MNVSPSYFSYGVRRMKDSLTESDITITSSDGVSFQMHRKNLKVCMKNTLALDDASGEVRLEEDSPTLNLLFCFAYPFRNPNIQSMDFNTVKSLAVAADKYAVHTAIHACRIYMKYIYFFDLCGLCS
jgi:hypothetical protein